MSGSERLITDRAGVSERRLDAKALDSAAEAAELGTDRAAEAAERRLAEAARAQEREFGAKLRTDVSAMVLEARAELVSLRDELARIGGDIRAAAGVAEDRVAQTARIAEATVSTRAQSAAAEAIRDLTSTAKDLSLRIERQAEHARGSRSPRRDSDPPPGRRSAPARVRRTHQTGARRPARGSRRERGIERRLTAPPSRPARHLLHASPSCSETFRAPVSVRPSSDNLA